MRLCIDKTWAGAAALPAETVVLDVELTEEFLEIRVDAPRHGDPPPAGPPGSTGELWDFEVVELFLLGTDDRYLEVELGPHGHYIVLVLHGARCVERMGMQIEYAVEPDLRRWRGVARVPLSLVPEGVTRGNAYAMHGLGASRRHLALYPVPGETPDFHRIECFGAMKLD